jgi:hypothetical protein
MEVRLSNLKIEFNNISLVRSKIINVFESLKNKSDKLKLLYADFIKQSNSQLFVFGLDSFHFQSKLIDLEYDDMKRIFLFVNNRMYCEYFKLYKLICCYVIENVTDKKILEILKGNNFPVYKDLEPFKDYKFEITLEIHENILVLLNSILSIINNRENELSIHKSKQLIGLNIDNFVNSFNYEIVLMKEKVNLFLSYIEFFHKLHAKYLKRFSNKIQLMSNHINSDIQFDENVENNVIKKSNDEFDEQPYSENNDKKLNLVIDTSVDDKNIFFEDFESGTYTPSNSSYKSIESKNTNKKFKMPKFIKNGIKKVGNMIIGCNNNEITNDILVNNEIVTETNEPSTFNEKLMISLNDFSDNVSVDEIKNIEASEESMINDEQLILEKSNEKETQTNENEEIVFTEEEQPVSVPVVEEEPVSVPVVEEEPVSVPLVEEEPVSVPLVEEEPVSVPVVEEEPLSVPVVEEEPVSVPVVEEEPVSVPLVEEEPVSVPVVEEEPVSVPVVEEEPVSVPVVEEEQPLTIE